jgi:hypothetical protein
LFFAEIETLSGASVNGERVDLNESKYFFRTQCPSICSTVRGLGAAKANCIPKTEAMRKLAIVFFIYPLPYNENKFSHGSGRRKWQREPGVP